MLSSLPSEAYFFLRAIGACTAGKDEFDNGVAGGWHRVPWTLGCDGEWTEEKRKEHH